MLRTKLSLLLLLLAPTFSFGSNLCIAISGGFGKGGSTFVEPSFSAPSEGKCSLWTGFTKTAIDVIVTTYGTGCLSSDGRALTMALSSVNPGWFGPGEIRSDYITMTRSESSKPFTTGNDQGAFSGDAEVVSCSSSLLDLPSSHE